MAVYRSDFLVIGSGLAGLLLARDLSRLGTVNLLTKRSAGDSSTDWAQGGIAAVTAKNDAFPLHEKDTLRTGSGLADPAAVKAAVEGGPAAIARLVALGVRFSGAPGSPELGLEGGHSRRRVLHCADSTGHSIHSAALAAARRSRNVRIFENRPAVDLVLRSRPSRTRPKGNLCLGAYVLDGVGPRVDSFLAGTTVLCTGGAGKVYRYTSNPNVATGDGMAMAYRAGLPLANLEFVQFHPTILYHEKAKKFLISEAVRGEGGRLLLKSGRRFMAAYDKRRELAPRDIVARAIDSELKRTGDECVYLDISHRDPAFVRRRFPNIYRRCLELGLDITREPIPVVPAAHFFCGGVPTDLYGRTAMPGLYAVGETAHTGLHGANRLASNSLLEAAVFSERAFRAIEAEPRRKPAGLSPAPWRTGNARPSDEAVVISQNWDEIRTLMWNYVGIVRSDKRLARARTRIRVIADEIHRYYWDFLVTRDLVELRNIACVAEQIIRSASRRKESRGLHYNIDYPAQRPGLARPTLVDRYHE